MKHIANKAKDVALRLVGTWIATLVNEMVPAKDKQITVPAAVTAALSKIFR